jgi:hypothetical protein
MWFVGKGNVVNLYELELLIANYLFYLFEQEQYGYRISSIILQYGIRANYV